MARVLPHGHVPFDDYERARELEAVWHRQGGETDEKKAAALKLAGKCVEERLASMGA